MVELTRTVRFCINGVGARTDSAGDNTFAAHPSMVGLGRFYELEVRCLGRVDPISGYFLNIKVIDQAVRATAVPMLERACDDARADPQLLLVSIAHEVNNALKGCVTVVRWKLTPFYSLELDMHDPVTVLMRQQFEFAASHRLHSPTLSDDENRRIFGKCNHSGGHGHNYRIEPCVAISAGLPDARPAFTLADLERVTSRVVIDRFDHKNLNEDATEFQPVAKGGRGLNPSVENIAIVCYELLRPAVNDAAHAKAELRSVTVWETDKTSCTYPPTNATN